MTGFIVTGANGFVGRHLCQHLSSRGHEVRGLMRGPAPEPGQVSIDYQNTAALVESVRGFEVLIHCAGRAHVLHKDSPDAETLYSTANVDLTMSLVRVAELAGVRRFVFISSAGVLGNSSGASELSDDSPVRPHDLYSSSKWEAEQRLARFRQGNRVGITVVRPVLVFGPGTGGNFDRLVRLIRRGWPVPVGGLVGRRSLIGIRNLCDFVAECSLRQEADGMTFVAADEEVTTLAGLAQAIGSVLDRPARIISIPDRFLYWSLSLIGHRRDYGRLANNYVVRPLRAAAVLGWRQPHDRASELQWALKEDGRA